MTKSRFVFCPHRPSGRKKLMNVCTSPVPSKVKFSNLCLLLYSSTGCQIFKHGLPIAKHVRACRHVKIGPGTACQSTSGHLTPSLPSRTVSRHICLNCHTASRSDDLFDVDRRPCSDARHVTAPYKSALYYYYLLTSHSCFYCSLA